MQTRHLYNHFKDIITAISESWAFSLYYRCISSILLAVSLFLSFLVAEHLHLGTNYKGDIACIKYDITIMQNTIPIDYKVEAYGSNGATVCFLYLTGSNFTRWCILSSIFSDLHNYNYLDVCNGGMLLYFVVN